MHGGYRWSPKGSRNPAFKGGLIANRAWFVENYKTTSLRGLADLAGCSLRTAARWAVIHGVTRRGPGCRLRSFAGANNPNWRGGPTPCEACGAPLKKGGGRRCRECQKKSYLGQGNPNFKGIADINVLLRTYLAETWRPKVYARDAFTCQRCGDSRGGNLTAHHIRRLEVIVEEALENVPTKTDTDRLNALELLKRTPAINDLANGITLCEPCHEAIHRGKRTAIVPVTPLRSN